MWQRNPRELVESNGGFLAFDFGIFVRRSG